MRKPRKTGQKAGIKIMARRATKIGKKRKK
jgi:hypothetical protein